MREEVAVGSVRAIVGTYRPGILSDALAAGFGAAIPVVVIYMALQHPNLRNVGYLWFLAALGLAATALLPLHFTTRYIFDKDNVTCIAFRRYVRWSCRKHDVNSAAILGARGFESLTLMLGDGTECALFMSGRLRAQLRAHL